jgi:hypothetical protein
MFITANQSSMFLFAVRQTDLALTSPATVWGTAAWGTSAGLWGNILIPI